MSQTCRIVSRASSRRKKASNSQVGAFASGCNKARKEPSAHSMSVEVYGTVESAATCEPFHVLIIHRRIEKTEGELLEAYTTKQPQVSWCERPAVEFTSGA